MCFNPSLLIPRSSMDSENQVYFAPSFLQIWAEDNKHKRMVNCYNKFQWTGWMGIHFFFARFFKWSKIKSKSPQTRGPGKTLGPVFPRLYLTILSILCEHFLEVGTARSQQRSVDRESLSSCYESDVAQEIIWTEVIEPEQECVVVSVRRKDCLRESILVTGLTEAVEKETVNAESYKVMLCTNFIEGKI